MLDDERAARRQPDLAVEGFVDLLVDVLALEQRQLGGLTVVVLDAVGEGRRDAGDLVADVFVDVLVVDDDAPVVLVELLADDPERHVGLAVEQRRCL